MPEQDDVLRYVVRSTTSAAAGWYLRGLQVVDGVPSFWFAPVACWAECDVIRHNVITNNRGEQFSTRPELDREISVIGLVSNGDRGELDGPPPPNACGYVFAPMLEPETRPLTEDEQEAFSMEIARWGAS